MHHAPQIQEKIPLWSHQRDAVKKAIECGSFGFFFDPGCGKTATTINTLRQLFGRIGGLCKTLILCPPVVIENWEREIHAHSHLPFDLIVKLNGTGKQRLEKLKNIGEKPAVVITNYRTLLMDDVFSELLKWSPLALVLDESHKCKSIKAKQTKRAIKLGDIAKFKFLLTGTFVLNDYMDVFSQFRILDGGDRFGENFIHFRKKYFYDKNAYMPKDKYFPNWSVDESMIEEMKQKINSISMTVRKEDALDLPPLVRKVIEVPLNVEQKRMYKEMKDSFITFIDEAQNSDMPKAVVAEMAVTKGLRLQQIISGFASIDGSNKVHEIKNNPRNDALKELLEDITPGHKVIVWAVFHQNYKDIRKVCESLKIKYVELHGEVKDKQTNIDLFNNDPKVRVLIGHPGSGGIGVNLIASSYSIYYSRNFNLEYDLQSEARNHRGGSEIHDKITRIDLVTPDTIDVQVLESLASKKKIGYKLLVQYIKENK